MPRPSKWYTCAGSSMPEQYRGKRALDLLVAGAATIATLPVGVIAGLAILIDDGRPVIFRQERVGRCGQRFTIYKFRTMRRDSPTVPSSQNDGSSVTRAGRVLRRLSIDELPQLVNVLEGHMSIVGPRPALSTQQEVLHARTLVGVDRLRPGLTGLAQVSSFDNMSPTQKVRFDERYMDMQSLRLDFQILGRTVMYLLKRPPIY